MCSFASRNLFYLSADYDVENTGGKQLKGPFLTFLEIPGQWLG